ncbi:MAG: hypothetical protein VB051_05360 [Candidatus Pelethousia sp.]|nr:hypothetical protein [Candidatus Pelethousia sp.]
MGDFAADFLLKDDAASELNAPPELLDFKFHILNHKGYNVIDPPLMAIGDFLKNDMMKKGRRQ